MPRLWSDKNIKRQSAIYWTSKKDFHLSRPQIVPFTWNFEDRSSTNGAHLGKTAMVHLIIVGRSRVRIPVPTKNSVREISLVKNYAARVRMVLWESARLIWSRRWEVLVLESEPGWGQARPQKCFLLETVIRVKWIPVCLWCSSSKSKSSFLATWHHRW